MWTKQGVHGCNRPAAPVVRGKQSHAGVPTTSTKRGVHSCNPAPASATVREPLPMDLLLEIVARCDVTTIVRCAGACNFLRRSILDRAFRSRLALQAAADGGGFDPACLFGVSYMAYLARITPVHHIIRRPSPIQLHASLLTCSLPDNWFEPVASRGRWLLLRRYGAYHEQGHVNVELQVADTTTGRATQLPSAATSYAHAFLSVSDACGSYELIVLDMSFRFQTFSSKLGKWDGGRQASVTGKPPYRLDASARVIGRTVYWLCRLNVRGDCWDGILALDVEGAEATTLQLPPGCLSRVMPPKQGKHLLLASVRGRLSLLVAESGGILMWALTPTSSFQRRTAAWSRQLVISAEEIVREVGLASSPLSYVLEGFGERSGAVIVRVGRRDLLRLDLGSKVVSRLHHPGGAPVASLFLHETDVASLLKKSFSSC